MSECLGDGRYIIPNRSVSKRPVPAAIISRAQHIIPKVNGQSELRLAHAFRPSINFEIKPKPILSISYNQNYEFIASMSKKNNLIFDA
jgi:hypothetical protein